MPVHGFILRSFINLIELLLNFMKLLPNHCMVLIEILMQIDFRYHNLHKKDIEESWYWIYYWYWKTVCLFNWSIYPLICSTKSGTSARVRLPLIFYLAIQEQQSCMQKELCQVASHILFFWYKPMAQLSLQSQLLRWVAVSLATCIWF